MRRDGWRFRGGVGAIALGLAANVAGAAAPRVSDEVVAKRIDELNRSAVGKIQARQFAGARAYLLDAEGMARERGGWVAGAALAPTYLGLAAVEIMAGGDVQRARHYFRRALCRQPHILPGEPISNRAVVRSFLAAKDELGSPLPDCRMLFAAREPDLPVKINALDCPTPDAALEGADFTVRCVVAGQLPVAKVTLRYRLRRSDEFAAVEMVRTARGWWTAAVPGKDVTGPSVIYFIEGKNAAGKAVVLNGEATEPRVALVFSPDRCACD